MHNTTLITLKKSEAIILAPLTLVFCKIYKFAFARYSLHSFLNVNSIPQFYEYFIFYYAVILF